MRFAVIDALLDVSTRDFAARPWVERMETAASVEKLRAEVHELLRSPLVSKHPQLVSMLQRAVA